METIGASIAYPMSMVLCEARRRKQLNIIPDRSWENVAHDVQRKVKHRSTNIGSMSRIYIDLFTGSSLSMTREPEEMNSEMNSFNDAGHY